MIKAEQKQIVWMEQYLAVVKCCEEDHLGSNRVVASTTGEAEQVTHYYPYGSTFYGESTSDQRFKYCGKELDKMHGLDWYDSSARFYDHVLGRFQQIDPLAEKYYSWSSYAYCMGNPINMMDVDGKSPWSKILKSGIKIGKQVSKNGIKALGEGATYAQAFSSVIDDVNTMIDSDASIENRVFSAVSLASELFPISINDAKDVGKLAKKLFKGNSTEKTINQLQKDVERGKAPKNIERFDKGIIKGEQDHVHFKKPKSALNKDGTWKHGDSFNIDNKTKNNLNKNGWKTD